MDHLKLDPSDEEAALMRETKSNRANAIEHFYDEVDRILDGLSLPLADSLGVPPEQVAARSQEILQDLIRLRDECYAAIDTSDKVLGDYVDSFPEEERKAVNKRLMALEIMMARPIE